MTNIEFARMAHYMATQIKTLYVNGCYAKRLTEAQKQYYIKNYSYNRGLLRKPKIEKASNDTVGADCICFLKAIIDGWNPKSKADDFDVKYVPAHDLTEEGLLYACNGVSSDFSNIEVGEYLYIKGHGGVYIGNGLAVECTPSWDDGIQITAVENIGTRKGMNGRKWTYHGKLSWLTYVEVDYAITPTLTYGSSGSSVKYLQLLLNAHGYSLEVDGSFGPLTATALERYQKSTLTLTPDVSCGPLTWASLLTD